VSQCTGMINLIIPIRGRRRRPLALPPLQPGPGLPPLCPPAAAAEERIVTLGQKTCTQCMLMHCCCCSSSSSNTKSPRHPARGGVLVVLVVLPVLLVLVLHVVRVVTGITRHLLPLFAHLCCLEVPARPLSSSAFLSPPLPANRNKKDGQLRSHTCATQSSMPYTLLSMPGCTLVRGLPLLLNFHLCELS
jgi:hypothetical protein